MPEDNRLPKRNSGVNAAQEPEPHTEKPARATVRRRRGQDPEVIPAKPKPAVVRAKRASMSLAQPTCPIGHPVTAAMKFCPECGGVVVVAGPPRCRNGHDIIETDKFCAICGTPLQGEAAAEVQSEAELVDKERAHKQAVAMGQENPVVSYAPGKAPKGVETIVVHFLVDGFSVCGVVWMRGQEIEIWPGHPRWRELQPWLTLDVAGQYAMFGRQIFGYGPWPGVKTYTAGAGHFQPLKAVNGDGTVAQPTEEELARADAAEKRRGRRVPMPMG